MDILRTEGLYKTYNEGNENEVHALKPLDISVEEGVFYAIIGRSGSGKSTLMNALLGLKKQSGGNIVFNKLKRNEIGVLPQQEPVERDFPATVREIVLSGTQKRAHAFPRALPFSIPRG